MPPKNQTADTRTEEEKAADKAAEEAAAKASEAEAAKAAEPKSRVVFKDGIPDEMDGFRFVSIIVDDTRYHVSEPMPLDRVARLVTIPGFAACPIAEDICGPLFDQAVATRDTAMQKSGEAQQTRGTRETELEQQLADAQAANTALAADVRAANERSKTLEESNVKLAKQIAAARAAGFVPKE